MPPRPAASAHRLRHVVATAPVALLAVCAAGCSGSPATGRAAVPGPQLQQQAADALRAMHLVHLSGTVSDENENTSDSITVEASSNSADASAGTLDLEGPGLGFEGFTHFIVFRGVTYLNAGSAFWKSLFGTQTQSVEQLEAEILPHVVDKWVGLSKSGTEAIYKYTFGLSEPRAFVSGTLRGLRGTLDNAGPQTVSGVRGIAIRSSYGPEVLVAPSGPPVPVALAASGTSGLDVALRVSYPAAATIGPPVNPVSLAAIESALAKP